MDDSTITQFNSPPPPAPSSLTLASWGPFQIIQKVGQGGFGEVYHAFDTTLQREVALKLLRPRGLNADAEAQEVLREARQMAKVKHPNVLTVHGVDTHDGRVGFWSDFVRGKTLSALLAINGPMSARETAHIGIDLAKAVGAVHSVGLLHRDIKGSNAMHEEGGRILLMDFGLTHEIEGAQIWSGTPSYMAPELVAGKPATVATDIYALGVLLFHLLTGKYPYGGETWESVRNAQETGTRLRLLDARPDLPEAFAGVVEKAADPNPARRFSSTGELISALAESIGPSSLSFTVPVPPPLIDERQNDAQGAIVCQDWPSKVPPSRKQYFPAADLPDNAHVHRMVHFLFACYGAGWPKYDTYRETLATRAVVAPAPTMARLPQALLSHRGGAALAVLGHVDMAVADSFQADDSTSQIEGFRSVMNRIMSGSRLGQATDQFNLRWAGLSVDLVTALQRQQNGLPVDLVDLKKKWIARDDARNYVLYGDPAVQLRTGDMPVL